MVYEKIMLILIITSVIIEYAIYNYLAKNISYTEA